MDRMGSSSTPMAAFTRHISSVLTFQTTKQEPQRPKHGKAEADAKSRSINKQLIALGRDEKWKDMLMLFKEQRQHFDAINYSTLMSKLGRIRQVQKDDPLLRALVYDLSEKLHTDGIAWMGNPRTLATIVHAIAKMGLGSNLSAMKIMRLVDHGETAEWLVDTGDPHSIANCVWACGKLKIQSPNLFQMLDERAQWFVDHGTPQALANCVYVCGTLGIESPNLFHMLDERAQWFVDNGNPQDIANCVWACGKLGIESPNLFQLLDQRAQWLVDNGNPQEIANCVWAHGKLGIESPNLFQLLDQRAEWLVDNGTPQNIVNCVWACGKLGIESPNLFRLLDERAEWLAENGNQQDLRDSVDACVKLGIESPNLFRLHVPS